MRVAILSKQAEHLALNNVAKPNGWPFFYGTQAEDLAVYNADLLYVHGFFVNEYGDWNSYRQLIGDTPRVVIRFTGTDVLQLAAFVRRGCTAVTDWLRGDRFLLIPPSHAVANELGALDLPLARPLNTPAQRIFDPIPRPKNFRIGVYLPPHRQAFFNIPKLKMALKHVKDYRVIFYHFLPLIERVEFSGPHEMRFALKREEYEKTIADCSCLIRMPVHDANSISTAEYLMADRPVVSLRDFPHWPALINEKMTNEEIAAVIEKQRDAPPVRETAQEYCRDMYDPAKWKDRLLERIHEKWTEVDFGEALKVRAA